MKTNIGRVVVSTTMVRRRGWIIWETAVLVYFPNLEGHWCYVPPEFDVFDRYLTQAESWIGHALVVGYLRTGLELEQPEPACIPVRECIGGQPQTIVLTMTQYRRWAAEHDVAFAAQAAWGILHGELPPGSPWRVEAVGAPFRGLLARAIGLEIEAAPEPMAPEPHVKSA